MPLETDPDFPSITSADERAGDRIGPYRLVHELGRGGMGVVYLAVRADDAYQKRVAIKIVKRGMDTDDILQRFRNERQILAGLDHPNIARLIDGGSTPDGVPYFVLEYITGRPITEYCDVHGLDIEGRLLLFLQVASAVHYAHQNLVIHRDLKPGNILVTPDGDPKLLDFGIAKLVTGEPVHTLDLTVAEHRLMTPEYASPEQVRGETMTTASDIYALGVILYEMLTDRRPYRITSRVPSEVARIICDEDPPKPSTIVGRPLDSHEADAAAAAMAANAPTGELGADVASAGKPLTPPSAEVKATKLARRLRGDLDTIVLKAMAKEPNRRYASVEQFADDIRRHLTNRPVIARPDTLGYRAAKFVRRNTLGVAAGGLIVLSLVAGIVGTTWQAAVARDERWRAERRFEDVRALANSFIFEVHDAIAPLSGATAARQLLVRRALQYLDRMAAEGSDDVTLLRELAAGYQKLGDVQGRRLNPNLGDTSGSLSSQRKALEMRERVARALPDDPSAQIELAISHLRVGEMLQTGGDSGGALAEFQEGARLIEAVLAKDAANDSAGRELAAAYDRIGMVKASQGDTKGSFAAAERSLAIIDRLLVKSPGSFDLRRLRAIGHYRLGNLLGNPNYANVGDTSGALVEFRLASDEFEALIKENPSHTPTRRSLAVLYSSISDVYLVRDQLNEARREQNRSLEIFRALLAGDPSDAQATRDVALNFSKLADIEREAGNYAAALEWASRQIPTFEALALSDPANVLLQGDLAAAYSVVGDLEIRLGRPDAARRTFERMTALQERVTKNDPGNSDFQYALATAYGQMGDATAATAATKGPAARDGWRAARRWYERAYEIFAALEKRGTLTGSDAGRPAKMQAEMARCDAALAKR